MDSIYQSWGLGVGLLKVTYIEVMPIENDLHSSLILSPKVGLFIKDDLKTKLKGYSAKAMIIKGDCKLKLFFFLR